MKDQFWKEIGSITVAVLACLSFSRADAESKADYWKHLSQLDGAWEGKVSGNLGTGTGTRTYAFIMDGQYLVWEHASVRLPQEKTPSGDYHREMGVFSYDPEREKLIIRSFIVEGFVNQYACDLSDRVIACRMENTEGSNSSQWSGLLTLTFHDDYSFTETFQLTPPNEAPIVILKVDWTRQPRFK